MIELSNVTLKRGETVTLDDVSLKFGAGGITALIGPNGAGKSTLLHTMSACCRQPTARFWSKVWMWCAPVRKTAHAMSRC